MNNTFDISSCMNLHLINNINYEHIFTNDHLSIYDLINVINSCLLLVRDN